MLYKPRIKRLTYHTQIQKEGSTESVKDFPKKRTSKIQQAAEIIKEKNSWPIAIIEGFEFAEKREIVRIVRAITTSASKRYKTPSLKREEASQFIIKKSPIRTIAIPGKVLKSGFSWKSSSASGGINTK